MCLEHLNAQEEKSVINFKSNSQDRFHIPGEKLTVTNVLQHQIPMTINIYKHTTIQISAISGEIGINIKEELNKQVEELFEGGIVKPSQSPYNTSIWIVSKMEIRKEARDREWY